MADRAASNIFDCVNQTSTTAKAAIEDGITREVKDLASP
jgi:hypothetical protein